MRNQRALLSLVLVLATTASGFSADLATGLKKCAGITDSLQRLVCYDELAKEASGKSGSAAGATTAPVESSTSTKATTSEPRRAPVSGRCQATTKKGTQCLRNAKAGSSYCWQHGG